MQLKYMEAKRGLLHTWTGCWDVAVLHSPFFGSGKLEYYSPPASGPGGARSTPSSPSQTCTAAT